MNSLPENLKTQLPGAWVPSFRTSVAIKLGTANKLLFSTSGGLGDQICAEPTLRYALEKFSGVEISVATMHPYFFDHLKFKNVFDLRTESPRFEDYLVVDTLGDLNPLSMDFFRGMSTHCVDYASLSSIRCQLPLAYKKILLPTAEPDDELTLFLLERDDLVVVHPGKHWPSRTFPKQWWDDVLHNLGSLGATPVLIGSDLNENQGTVNVNEEGCIDLRNRMTLMETASFLQRSKVLLTNDSGPLHLAATGDAWIGFVATSKHPDYIYHWREGGFAWKMENFGLGGMWDLIDNCPNKDKIIPVDQVDAKTLATWLPDPKKYAEWAVSKL